MNLSMLFLHQIELLGLFGKVYQVFNPHFAHKIKSVGFNGALAFLQLFRYLLIR